MAQDSGALVQVGGASAKVLNVVTHRWL
jgi:hypothetical protein